MEVVKLKQPESSDPVKGLKILIAEIEKGEITVESVTVGTDCGDLFHYGPGSEEICFRDACWNLTCAQARLMECANGTLLPEGE